MPMPAHRFYEDGKAVGQTWGWPLTPNRKWWSGLDADGLDTAETGSRTFALSEIMVVRSHAGSGIAHALHDEILSGRGEQRATLLVEPENQRAYLAYQKWGWNKAGTLQPSWPSAPALDVLMRKLPIKDADS